MIGQSFLGKEIQKWNFFRQPRSSQKKRGVWNLARRQKDTILTLYHTSILFLHSAINHSSSLSLSLFLLQNP